MMLASTDWAGIAAVIGSIGGAIAAVVAAVYGRGASQKADSAAVKATALGASVDEVHAAVQTPQGSPTLGVVAVDTNTTVKNGNGNGHAPEVQP